MGKDAKISRRQFIGLSFAGLGLLALGSGAILWRLGSYPSSQAALNASSAAQSLSKTELFILAALAVWFNPNATAHSDESLKRQLLTMDRFLTRLEPFLRLQFHGLLYLFEHGSLLFGRNLSRFTRMDTASQRAYLEGWQKSRWGVRRLAFTAIKSFLYIGAYENPKSWKTIAYDGPMVDSDWDPAFKSDYEALRAAAGQVPS